MLRLVRELLLLALGLRDLPRLAARGASVPPVPSTAEQRATIEARAATARTIANRLRGAEYEIETSIAEARKLLPDDALLDAHLDGALVDVEGALQRLLATTPGAACTPA